MTGILPVGTLRSLSSGSHSFTQMSPTKITTLRRITALAKNIASRKINIEKNQE